MRRGISRRMTTMSARGQEEKILGGTLTMKRQEKKKRRVEEGKQEKQQAQGRRRMVVGRMTTTDAECECERRQATTGWEQAAWTYTDRQRIEEEGCVRQDDTSEEDGCADRCSTSVGEQWR